MGEQLRKFIMNLLYDEEVTKNDVTSTFSVTTSGTARSSLSFQQLWEMDQKKQSTSQEVENSLSKGN